MSLRLFQNDIEITPYVLPKNRIFRPPKSYVQNLKKKDYLGKAKVSLSSKIKKSSGKRHQ